MKVYTQCTPPPAESEKIDKQDLAILDKTSLTSVVDFIKKFQSDASFAPPTKDVSFDSENFEISIDDEGEFPSLYEDLENLRNE